MQIYFLRHANAGEPKLNPSKDEKRPLDKLGVEQSHDVGRALAALNITVDAIVTSPLRRATQTASVVANEIDFEGRVTLDDALRPGATYDQFQELLHRHSRKEAIMVVGHNPTMTEFLNTLLGAAPHSVELKKGAIARVEKEGRKAAVLKWCMPPKLVRSIQELAASSSRPKTVSK
jgi:phosphohistidine phosphatase